MSESKVPTTFAVRALPVASWALVLIVGGSTLVEIGMVWWAPSATYPLVSTPMLPALPENVHAGGIEPAALQQGGFTSGEGVVAGADVASRIWRTLSLSAWAALYIAVAVSAARLARAVQRGEPFAHALARGVTTLAVLVLVLGLAWQWFDQTTAYSVSNFLYGGYGAGGRWTLDENTSFLWPTPRFALDLNLWPVWAALALGALAALLRYGGRLERDTRGLV